MFRRLYSSLPERVAEATQAAKPRAPTRGRSPRPVRVALKRSPAPPTPAAAPPATHGRRLRRGQLARTDLVSTEPGPHFEPITLYPLQAGLHLGLTPAHMPLPLPLGTKGYTSPSEAPEGALFEKPAAPSPLSSLEALPAGTSAVGEHLRVARAFAHPSLRHHLAAPSSGSVSVLGFDEHLTSALDAAAAKHQRAADDAWEAALTALGRPTPAPAAPAADPQLADALAGLNGLLARLEASAGTADDIVVEMDSVKRKRKKKMNKHKYKKRRKATRAIRKRLGK